jgi:hypothetical protein
MLQQCTIPASTHTLEALIFRQDFNRRVNELQEVCSRRLIQLKGPVPRLTMMRFLRWDLQWSNHFRVAAAMMWYRVQVEPRYSSTARILSVTENRLGTWTHSIKSWLATLDPALLLWRPACDSLEKHKLKDKLQHFRKHTLVPCALRHQRMTWESLPDNVAYRQRDNLDHQQLGLVFQNPLAVIRAYGQLVLQGYLSSAAADMADRTFAGPAV